MLDTIASYFYEYALGVVVFCVLFVTVMGCAAIADVRYREDRRDYLNSCIERGGTVTEVSDGTISCTFN